MGKNKNKFVKELPCADSFLDSLSNHSDEKKNPLVPLGTTLMQQLIKENTTI